MGRYHEIKELVDIVLRDNAYYQTSKGGVTLSGGEPMLFVDYASQLLQELKSNGLHTAIESCGFFDYSEFETRLPRWLDLVLLDIKLADAELHLRYTGKRNDVILANVARLVQERPNDVVARVPLIPDICTDAGNLQQIADLFKEKGNWSRALLTSAL